MYYYQTKIETIFSKTSLKKKKKYISLICKNSGNYTIQIKLSFLINELISILFLSTKQHILFFFRNGEIATLRFKKYLPKIWELSDLNEILSIFIHS